MIRLNISIRLLVAILAIFLLSCLAIWLVPSQLKSREANRQAQIIGQITNTLQQREQVASLIGAIEIDKVYLVSWKGSDTQHISLYVGGVLIDIGDQPITTGTTP
jgi:hypothetical protein